MRPIPKAPARRLLVDAAKRKFCDCIAQGMSVKDASITIGRSPKTYDNWRAADPDFKARIDEIRASRNFMSKADGPSPENFTLGFREWRKKFLDRETYSHQQMWIDILEGRKPVDIHPMMRYEPARDTRILINTPPFHAKSTVITQEYVVYRICMNPQTRICIISKTQTKAKKFIVSIKKMLTGVQYAALQAAYAPSEGFRDKDSAWTANYIYVGGRSDAEKDPTVEALGIRGDLYGGRFDLIILDDCITKENVAEWEKQLDWINQEVSSRLFKGKILVVGTRVAPIDLYSQLLNPDNFVSGRTTWTYLSQPAVLEFADDPKDWKTLWPRSNAPLDAEDAGEPDEDGTWAAWDGPALREVRDSVRLSTWSLVYMQQQVSDDAIFNPVCVQGSINRLRKCGPLRPGAFGHPRQGMEGQYVIGSMDPAMAGDTFTMVTAVDRRDNFRRVMNCWVKTAPTPLYIRQLIKDVTELYGVNEWVIEQNAFQLFLIHDEDIRRFCQTRGVKITPHYTSRNKADPDFGVASVAPLFGSVKIRDDSLRKGLDHNGDNLIELPDVQGNEGVKALIDQLITWEPGKQGKQLKQDGPMALWFMELRARALLGEGRSKRQHFVQNPYLSRGDRKTQSVIPLESYRYARQG